MIVQKNLDMDIPKLVRNANYQMQKETFKSKREQVYSVLLQHPEGLTDHEISQLTGLSLSCVNARRNELYKKDMVCPVGVMRFKTNRPRTLWGTV